MITSVELGILTNEMDMSNKWLINEMDLKLF
jgi:hypothetical protein